MGRKSNKVGRAVRMEWEMTVGKKSTPVNPPLASVMRMIFSQCSSTCKHKSQSRYTTFC
ncbi:hypothetical protein J6590_055019 [Homalodisca vitripennis]|nr:hypothetical protein J6590_055019 [Homalodisca vitripennis]